MGRTFKKPVTVDPDETWKSKDPKELAYEIATFMGGTWPTRPVRKVQLELDGAPDDDEELFEMTKCGATAPHLRAPPARAVARRGKTGRRLVDRAIKIRPPKTRRETAPVSPRRTAPMCVNHGVNFTFQLSTSLRLRLPHARTALTTARASPIIVARQTARPGKQ